MRGGGKQGGKEALQVRVCGSIAKEERATRRVSRASPVVCECGLWIDYYYCEGGERERDYLLGGRQRSSIQSSGSECRRRRNSEIPLRDLNALAAKTTVTGIDS